MDTAVRATDRAHDGSPMPRIQSLHAREILDSRGTPTVEATCVLTGGATASAAVPSGRSTGVGEALELRDGDPARYRGRGCRQAAANVNGAIHEALAGNTFADQHALDQALIDLDGTDNKRRLGANAILAVSVAFARACAVESGVPLYTHLAGIVDRTPATIPRLTINLFSGGEHAGRQVSIQDVLLVPSSPRDVDGALVMMHAIYHAALDRLQASHDMRWLTADEGGLAPPLDSSEAMIAEAVEAIRAAGYTPGVDAHLAMDVAASHFFDGEAYALDGGRLTPERMIQTLDRWSATYPIVSIEDGLDENDWAHWPTLCRTLGDRLLVLGDDLLCTNPRLIDRAVEAGACNALLLKVNQIGTLTEAAEAHRRAKAAGWHVTISVRSGETEDDWAADLAVGWGGDQFKNGSITQSERLAKYNRLLAIAAETGLEHPAWPLADPQLDSARAPDLS